MPEGERGGERERESAPCNERYKRDRIEENREEGSIGDNKVHKLIFLAVDYAFYLCSFMFNELKMHCDIRSSELSAHVFSGHSAII